MTCHPPEQMHLASTRSHPGGVRALGNDPLDPGKQDGASSSKPGLCPACGGILRVESYTSQRPGREPEVRAVGICTGQGVTRKADGVRWRPRAGCGRFVL